MEGITTAAFRSAHQTVFGGADRYHSSACKSRILFRQCAHGHFPGHVQREYKSRLLQRGYSLCVRRQTRSGAVRTCRHHDRARGRQESFTFPHDLYCSRRPAA